jgi:hypothetical protein
MRTWYCCKAETCSWARSAKGYQSYDMCTGDPNENLCKLRVALDRIFWKGDYLEYVAVKGQDIEKILGQSDALIQQQSALN